MTYGPVSLSSFQSADIIAPAAPSFVSIAQIDNTTIEVTLLLPYTDFDGTTLTGLKKITLATDIMIDGINPFEGMDMPTILAIPSARVVDIDVSDLEAGTQRTVQVPVVNLGGFQAFAAAAAD